jgi:hypothetical protein
MELSPNRGQLMIFEIKTENRASANQPWWGFPE